MAEDQSDLLFHGTSIYSLANILDEDRLCEGVHWGKPGEPRGPRFSRSPRAASEFVRYNIHWGEGGLLVLDRRGLEAAYRVVPYTDAMYGGHPFPVDEEEEVVITPSICPLRRFLVGIVCDPQVIALAQQPQNLRDAREECGWGFSHEDDDRAIESLRRLAKHPLLNVLVPGTGLPRMGNWLDASGRPFTPEVGVNPESVKECAMYAFEVTQDDVANVLRANAPRMGAGQGRAIDSVAADAFNGLDFGAVEAAALGGDSMDEQTQAAYAEIERQLVDDGVLTAPETATARRRARP